MASPTAIVGYLLLFSLIGFVFLFANLTLGRLVRPRNPSVEKGEIYECGETTIGSSFVQFDLRFYVVALVFIVFDVEVAFLFPIATVFGKSTQLVASADDPRSTAALYEELGVPNSAIPVGTASDVALANQNVGRSLGVTAFAAMMVFFAILLVGFAYEWKCGAFNWVRSTANQVEVQSDSDPPATSSDKLALVASGLPASHEVGSH